MESLFLSNIDKFTDDACGEYRVWLNAGIYMQRAGFDVSTFIAFSKLDAQRFNETECIKKYDSFDKYEPDSKPMSFYLKKKGIIASTNNTHVWKSFLKNLLYLFQ